MYTLWVEWYNPDRGPYWVARTSYPTLGKAQWAMDAITSVPAKITDRDGTVMATNGLKSE